MGFNGGMKRLFWNIASWFGGIACWLAAGTAYAGSPNSTSHEAARQFIVLNRSGGDVETDFRDISKAFSDQPGQRIRYGVGDIFSYFRKDPAEVQKDLERFLKLSEKYDMPVVVQLDGEQWWEARPDLWNWWDPSQPGYNPSNRFNVEWSGWEPEDAIRIAWRNWGTKFRVLPPPNLMSPAYRAAWHGEMKRLVPVIVHWWKHLPKEKRDLLVGVKVGWESSIGVNAWYYPHGNDLADQPAANDPPYGLKGNQIPSRGMATLGYAAARSAGLRTHGELTEGDQAEVVRRHLEDLSHVARQCGLPREKIFTHAGAWKTNEMLFGTALNRYSCPGWSVYHEAYDPHQCSGIQNVLAKSDAKYWAGVEWYFQGKNKVEPWMSAFQKNFVDPRCRYVCIYNWPDIRKNPPAREAIAKVLAGSTAQN